MKSYTIYFRFRGRERQAQVHQHETFYFVYFTDIDLINDFGGKIEYGKDKKPVSQQSAVKDAISFYKVVGDQLH